MCSAAPKCVNIKGTEYIVSVVVIDGISIGCPCCGKHNCHLPLTSNRDHFCPAHHDLKKKCAIIDCEEEISTRGVSNGRQSQVCDDPVHREIERLRREKGQSRFILKERLLHQRVSHPEDSSAKDIPVEELQDIEEDEATEEVFAVDASGKVDANVLDNSIHRGTTKTKKVRSQFGRKRSHNEQIFVAPCGEIIARETFFGAEAVSSVVVRRADLFCLL